MGRFKNWKWMPLIVALPLAWGCGKKTEAVPAPPVPGTDLSGVWATECHPSDGVGTYVRETIEGAGPEFTRRRAMYRDNACASELTTITEHAIYQPVGDAGLGDGSQKMDFGFDRVTVTANNADGKQLLENLVFCGVSKWNVGTEVDLSSASNQPNCSLARVPRTSYDVVKIVDTRLYFGSDGTVISPRFRPSQTDLKREYVKQ